ncbi:uncharacterized protein BDV17DRAFT_289650 [Aspergillus undulatus]|uniref:uncharacterized protein n=1 Tax=Aspergillus undulatus TaxID=1810928 RepID=UPI003CCDC94C
MSVSGIMSTLSSLVIRAISDYADLHKNDYWPPYAAVAAAAYAKDSFGAFHPPIAVPRSARGSGPRMCIVTQDRGSTVQDILDLNGNLIGAHDWRNSVIDLLKILGLNWDVTSHQRLAEALHINDGPTGFRQQNIALRRAIMDQLTVEEGYPVIPEYMRMPYYFPLRES